MGYDQRVREKFPCPAGYQELEPFDTAKVVYDRKTFRGVEVLEWRDEKRITTFKDITLKITESSCWYVKRAEKMGESLEIDYLISF